MPHLPGPRQVPFAVDEVLGPLSRTADEHMFELHGVGRTTCRVQVLTGSGAPVLLFTQEDDGREGASLMNRAESLAWEAWQRFLPEVQRLPVVVQQYGAAAVSAGRVRRKVVRFEYTDDGRLVVEDWRPVPAVMAAQLERCADSDRGSGYEPHVCLPPDRVEVWLGIPTEYLPATAPFRARCMERRSPQDLGGLSAALMAAAGADCCWYHGQDWAAATVELAARLKAGTDLYAQWPPQIEEAVNSLVIDPIHLRTDDVGALYYVNGQHRCQAMKDQGVSVAVVTTVRAIAASPLPGELALSTTLPPACC